jgi:hypothetical protein
VRTPLCIRLDYHAHCRAAGWPGSVGQAFPPAEPAAQSGDGPFLRN